jgi:hypothetical protein
MDLSIMDSFGAEFLRRCNILSDIGCIANQLVYLILLPLNYHRFLLIEKPTLSSNRLDS